MRRLLVAVATLVAVSGANAAVVAIDVTSREPVAAGSAFGPADAFERLSGTIRFAVDPDAAANRRIADIGLAPRNEAGLVEFDADFYLIKPERMDSGNKSLLFEVSNRGGKGLFRMFSRARGSLDPISAEELGDGFLLENGYTLLWVGWQFDPPEEPGLLHVRPPVAMADGVPLRGLVRSDFVVRQAARHHSLADRNHRAYPVADAADPANRLSVRDTPLGERQPIPRSKWRFARLENGRLVPSDTDVSLEGGFEPHRIYEIVYRGTDAALAGLGLAAIRDAVSELKYEGAPALGIEAGGLDRALAFGLSQSGRLLRQYLYDGFNADEADRRVFDGVMAHIAGGARGSFNHRFAQPSRASWSYFYPNAIFPYADIEQRDPATGEVAGLLAGIEAKHLPKIFYTNSSNEYWRGTAALTHTSLDGERDLAEMDNVRSFQFAGTQHVATGFPPSKAAGQQPGNPNGYSWFLRGLLVALEEWVRDGRAPPPSQHPNLEDGTLVPFAAFEFPRIPGAPAPTELSAARAIDFGAQFEQKRIITNEPPIVGAARPLLVPRVDADGNEIAGLRSPLEAVPLATFTGWNLFDAAFGPPQELVALQGSYIPLPKTRDDPRAAGDPRRPIAERYGNRDKYLQRVREQASKLAAERYVLPSDVEAIVAEASMHWDYLMH